mmetsp:Transcript_8169/g.12532  ORF Transcript_8169/g.12532 Transcript_8169/m.12532 type:complete len:287 (+) Transcript_8169:94-954(+)|eukprot:CAMPEP_0178903502 /NCGR_PEP_ID=MMETSP0786-20121207/5188_1 /TAXON_ID=186022 /ORGANISM="Thalassionema frauenfeldii, Strain CCMP 1798" /LENGTH=286 /DNA_ID=CAMNT_0020574871 /DNA_START=54 /DNA_END=914 /DNA_ORIENTATION=-
MSGLEDRILKKNIPGKYSWWDDYKDDVDERECWKDLSNGHDLQHRNEQNQVRESQVAATKAGYKIDSMVGGPQNFLSSDGSNSSLCAYEESISLQGREQKLWNEKIKEDRCNDFLDDNAFLALYREKRLEELKRKQKNLPEDDSRVQEVSPIEYSSAVDEGGTIIVHLYEVHIENCDKIRELLEKLAESQWMRNVRFLSLQASKVSQKIDDIGLPSVLIHRSGKLIGNLTPITNDLPHSFTLCDLHGLLETYIETPLRGKTSENSVSENDSDQELDEFCRDFDEKF